MHADEDIVADRQKVAQGCIHAEETALSDFAVTRDYDVRSNISVVTDRAAVTQMITGPDHNIVADRDGWLDRLVLENETIFANLEIGPRH